MNPLPNRPLLNNPSLPLTLPNIPSFDQMPYNGRPRKMVPEVGKDFPMLNGMSLGGLPNAPAAPNNSGGPSSDRDPRISSSLGGLGHQIPSQHSHMVQPGVFTSTSSQSNLQLHQAEKDRDSDEGSESQSHLPIPRLRLNNLGEWGEQFGLSQDAAERAQMEKEAQVNEGIPGHSVWEGHSKYEEDETEKDEVDTEEESNVSSEGDGRRWRAKRTLRRYGSVKLCCIVSIEPDICTAIWIQSVQ